MTSDGLKAHTAAVPGQDLDLSPDGIALWQPQAGLVPFFEALTAKDLLIDAIMILPQLMDKRRAIWWGCLCCWSALRPEPAALDSKALAVTVAWVCDPSEAARQAAYVPGEEAGLGDAAGCLATAVYLSSGSMLPPHLPAVPPPPHLSGQVVSTAVILASAAGDPEEVGARHHEFVELGRAVAAGRYPWPAPGVPLPPRPPAPPQAHVKA
jgi:hypothetical protein